jgi:hypothetical protein
MIMVEAPGWQGATKAHTAGMELGQRGQARCIGREGDRLYAAAAIDVFFGENGGTIGPIRTGDS